MRDKLKMFRNSKELSKKLDLHSTLESLSTFKFTLDTQKSYSRVLFTLNLGTCHYLTGGGRATILGGRVIIFSLLSGGGSNFFQGFLGEGHNYLNYFY